MAFVTHRQETITGADLTGSGAGRTYSLSYPNSIATAMAVYVQGSALQYAQHYTFSSGVITFTNVVLDSWNIVISYLTQETSTIGGADTEYATPEQLTEFMGLLGLTLDRDSNTVLEVVGVGGASTKYILKHAGVLDGTYTLYCGAGEGAALAQPLTETTHYTIDLETGIVSLTSVGVTLISTNNIYADYKYNIGGVTNGQLQDALNRAASQIENDTDNLWTDGSAATPRYEQRLDEKRDGKGLYGKNYFSLERPLPDVSTTTTSSTAIGAVSIDALTDGFPSSGYLGFENQKIVYTGKTSSAFTGVTGVTAVIASGSELIPYVIEASNTIEGTSPTFTVLKKGDDYDMNFVTGRIQFGRAEFNTSDAQAYALNPPSNVANRFRVSYLRGNSSIPSDVSKLTIMVASQELMHSSVRNATLKGMDNFQPGLVDVDDKVIMKILNSYRLLKAG